MHFIPALLMRFYLLCLANKYKNKHKTKIKICQWLGCEFFPRHPHNLYYDFFSISSILTESRHNEHLSDEVTVAIAKSKVLLGNRFELMQILICFD